MAATKKTAKRSAGKKSSKAKGSSTGKKSSRKASPKRRAGKSRGLATVRQVGEKTWKTLKTTTAQVVEGVKETFGG